MSEWKGGKSASAEASGHLKGTLIFQCSIEDDIIECYYADTVADTSPSDNFLWTGDRKVCVGDMLEIL